RWYDTRYAAMPCWERELASLLSNRNPRGWTVARGGRVAGFMQCRLVDSASMLRIEHIGLLPEAGIDDLRALCTAAWNDCGAAKLRIGSEPQDSRAAIMFRELGFVLDKDLWEMVKRVSAPTVFGWR